MRTRFFLPAALACCAFSCRAPSWGERETIAPDAQILVTPAATAPDAMLSDGGEPADSAVFTPGRSVAPSAGSLRVMPGRAISGTLELSSPGLENFATVCTKSLCATGGLRP